MRRPIVITNQTISKPAKAVGNSYPFLIPKMVGNQMIIFRTLLFV